MFSMKNSPDINLFSQSWEDRAILLLDLDAFFASVEQLDHPQWRGKPVIVGGDSEKRGVVSTCSYEARAFGVRSAMPSAIAKRLCPDAIWTESHFDRYHELSGKVMQIMYDESPLLEQVSIDEAFLDVTPGKFSNEDPVKIASRISKRVAELGVTCSIGIATSKCVAKIASDMDKPRGMTIVYPGSEAHFLANMPVRKMPGIGGKSAEKLQKLGIETLEQLAQAPLCELKPIFGVNAQDFKNRAAGIDAREVEPRQEIKSVSHERTFAQDLTTQQEIEDAIDYLGSLVGRRLRKKGLAGHTVTLKLRYADLSHRTAQKSTNKKMDDERSFIPIAKNLLPQLWQPGMSVRLVGVGISGFDDTNSQMELFDIEDIPEHDEAIISAADKVRDKFGDDFLKFGRELKLKMDSTGTQGQNDGNVL